MNEMDRFDTIAQAAWEKIFQEVKTRNAKGETLEKLAIQMGTKKNVLSEWLNGKKQAVNTSFPNMLRYIDALGLSIYDFLPEAKTTMCRFGAHSMEIEVGGENLMSVPIYGEAGAGLPSEVFSYDAEAASFLQVLPEFYKKEMVAIKVTGDSMEPLIQKNSFVGVVPFDGTLVEGGIYLVRRPPFGLLVKRVRMDKSGQIVLDSENSEYEPQIVPFDGYEDIIVGRVVWGWQLYC